MIPYSSLYDILSIHPEASPEDIKTAFRREAMTRHPDKNANSPESQADFILLYNAYSVLSDPGKRHEYDAYLKSSAGIRRPSGKAKRGTSVTAVRRPAQKHPTLEKILGQLNVILWDIEDILQATDPAFLDRDAGGQTVRESLLDLLVFFDRWVITPGGYPDYFFQARKMEKPDIDDYTKPLAREGHREAHRPFADIGDYFYDIRRRTDSFLDRVRLSELMATIPGTGLRILDCAVEAVNYSVHILTGLKTVLSGEAENIPPFVHSNGCYRKPGGKP